jgi:tetratricopeptide (TPR) repeat protein
MRVSPVVAALIAFTALALVQQASAADDPNWQACVGSSSAPEQRVNACTAVIDGKTETGGRLAGAYCSRGHGLTEQRQLDAALADLNEAIRLQPSFALAYNNRGDARLAKGDVPQAMTDFDTAIKLDPNLAIAYGNRGYVFYRMRDMTHAIADYNMQIKLKPSVLAYINRRNAYRDSEQLDRAATDYAEVIRLAPEDARGWRNRGLIRLFQGDNKGGIADYDKALQYDAADAYSWNNRAQAKLRLGDRQGAIADYRKALELQPSPEGARDNLRKLGLVL